MSTKSRQRVFAVPRWIAGDDLLGEDELDAVATHADRCPAEQAWHVDLLGSGPQRITEIDIDVELDDERREAAMNRRADAAVEVVVANRRSCRCRRVELEAIVAGDCQDLVDQCPNVVDVVGEVYCRQIDVPRRTTSIERRQQHSALEDESVSVRRAAQSVEESFERVELQQLIGGSADGGRCLAEVEVRPATRSRSCRSPRHSRT